LGDTSVSEMDFGLSRFPLPKVTEEGYTLCAILGIEGIEGILTFEDEDTWNRSNRPPTFLMIQKIDLHWLVETILTDAMAEITMLA
jgi:hypothetical protein